MGIPDVDLQTRSGRSRVLVVDDEPAILMTTEAILEERYVVDTARSGEEALGRLATHEFEAVCADYSMGRGLNGLDLLRTVAAMPTIIGRVLITGQAEVGESASLCYVLMKPYEPSRLVEVVERAVSQALARRRIAMSMSDARRATTNRQTGLGVEATDSFRRRS